MIPIERLDEVYQLKICILNQDFRKAKSIDSMIRPLLPCNMLLLFCEEYRGAVKQEIGSPLSITFITVFYPLFNLPKLYLNQRWKLNGKKRLNGYDGSGRIDLYPVGMEFEVPVREKLKEAEQFTFLVEVMEQKESGQEVEVKTFTAYCGEIEEEITMQTATRAEVKAGNETLYNVHRLDGERKLSGSLKLNGGFYQL